MCMCVLVFMVVSCVYMCMCVLVFMVVSCVYICGHACVSVHGSLLCVHVPVQR